MTGGTGAGTDRSTRRSREQILYGLAIGLILTSTITPLIQFGNGRVQVALRDIGVGVVSLLSWALIFAGISYLVRWHEELPRGFVWLFHLTAGVIGIGTHTAIVIATEPRCPISSSSSPTSPPWKGASSGSRPTSGRRTRRRTRPSARSSCASRRRWRGSGPSGRWGSPRRRRAASAATPSSRGSRCSSWPTSEDRIREAALSLERSGLAALARKPGVALCAVSAPIEAEMADLSPEDARAFREDLSLAEPGLDRVIRSTYDLLGLISFLTAGDDECRAWTVRRGTRAQAAAREIHSDEERVHTVGRRKSAVARIWIKPGKSTITVNRKPIEQYMTRETDRILIRQPLTITDNLERFDISVTVRGGGISGLAGAIRHAISRALASLNPDLRLPLKKAALLTRDARVRERKKYGMRGARARYQYSKR